MSSIIVRLIVLTAFFATFIIQVSECCSCLLNHPQDNYCYADFVILARIKREFLPKNISDVYGEKIYKVRIRKEFKMSDKAKEALKGGRIITQRDSATCGVEYDIGKLYVIAGSVHHLQAHVSLCEMNVLWSQFTRRQRKGLKMMYAKGCNCKIQKCHSYYHGSMKKNNCYKPGCKWIDPKPSFSDCYSRYGFCLSNKRNDHCHWGKSKDLKNCLKKGNEVGLL